MEKKRRLIALMAVLALLFAGLRATGDAHPVGLDLSVGQDRTHVVLTLALLRLAFDFEHDRPKSDSGWGSRS